MLAETAAAWFACKAVLSAAEARACRSFEFDLSLTTDGVLVLAHDPVPYAWKDAKGRYVDLDSFVAGLGEKAFDHVNLDMKERALLPGDVLARAFSRHATALRALDARTKNLVISSAVPARFEEIERWLLSSGLKAKPGLEVADYTAEQARSWGVPLSRRDELLLPLGAWLNRRYVKKRAKDVPYLMVQEATAEAGGLPPGPALVCWTRDKRRGPPPAACRWAQRRLE